MKRLAVLLTLAACAAPQTSASVEEGEAAALAGTSSTTDRPTPTWARPTPRPSPSRAARTRTARGLTATGSGQLNWHALAKCESTNNPKAISATGKYRGLYQFDLRTWQSVGGTGDPAAASPAEQTHRARLLYKQRGRAPWPVCGRRL